MRKKIIALLFFICLSQVSKAEQYIGFEGIAVSQLNANQLNVNLKVLTCCGADALSSFYTIENSIITLNVCYIVYGSAVILHLEHDFQVDIPSSGNYTLNVKIYDLTTAFNCDYSSLQDSATLNFSAPLSETITLSSLNFSNTDTAILYPNPTDGLFHISDNVKGSSISIYDELGRNVKTIDHLKEDYIDMGEFENGMYLVEIQNSNTKMVRKLTLKK
ncbi:MAG: T9SS type A sorting domain-containing protein [Flavobacterium sp.]|jgi:hypothetical protein|nr:T9SS type A sorting domain-containing protein [Flavobacterium sp.]